MRILLGSVNDIAFASFLLTRVDDAGYETIKTALDKAIASIFLSKE